MPRELDKLKAVNVGKIRKVGLHSDGGGLLLAVTKTKSDFARSWLFQYTSPTTGKVRQKGLGPLHTVKLGEARDIAEDLRKLVKNGIDPIMSIIRHDAPPVQRADYVDGFDKIAARMTTRLPAKNMRLLG